MTYIALGNFLCDGVSVSKGELLSVEKAERLQSRLDLLQQGGLLEINGVAEPIESEAPVVVEQEEPVVEKKRKKKVT